MGYAFIPSLFTNPVSLLTFGLLSPVAFFACPLLAFRAFRSRAVGAGLYCCLASLVLAPGPLFYFWFFIAKN